MDLETSVVNGEDQVRLNSLSLRLVSGLHSLVVFLMLMMHSNRIVFYAMEADDDVELCTKTGLGSN